MNESPYRIAEDAPPPGVIVCTTTADVPGYRIIEVAGLVRGLAMLPFQGFGNPAAVVGTREAAVARLLGAAQSTGANAIVGVRFDSSNVDVCAYGTAVVIAKL